MLCALVLAVALPVSAEAAGGSSSSKAKATFSDTLLVVEPMLVSVIQDSQIRGNLIVEVGLDIPNSSLRNTAEKLMPRLRDQFMLRLNRFAGTRIRMQEVPDVESIAMLLQRTTDRVLGEPGAQVLLSQIILK